MKQDKETIKSYFKTGDKPTEEQFEYLVDSYIDSKQPEGEGNRRFVIDKEGNVEVASGKNISEYMLSEIAGNKLALLKDGVVVKEVNLTPYLDDTNLARLVSGKVNNKGIATFIRDDDSIFTIDFSNLKVISDLQEVTDNGSVTSNPIIVKKILSNSTPSGDELAFSSKLDGDSLEFKVPPSPYGGDPYTIKLMHNGTRNNNTLVLPDKTGTLAVLNDVPKYKAGKNITIDNTDPSKPIINVSNDNSQNLQETLDNGNEFNTDINGKDANLNINNGKIYLKKASVNPFNNDVEINGTSVRVNSKGFSNDRSMVTVLNGSNISSSEILKNNTIVNTSIDPNQCNISEALSGGGINSSQQRKDQLSFTTAPLPPGVLETTVYSQKDIEVNSNGNNLKISLPAEAIKNGEFNTINETLEFPVKSGIIATTSDILEYQAGENIIIDNSNPKKPVINATAGNNLVTKEYFDVNQTVKKAKIILIANEIVGKKSIILIPAQGVNTIIDVMSIHTVFNIGGTSDYNFGDFLEFNHNMASISLGEINGNNFVVKTTEKSKESKGIPVNQDLNLRATGQFAKSDGATVYVSYRIIELDKDFKVPTISS